MSFNWSSTSGCAANSNDASYNPSIVNIGDNARAAHINELRTALEDWVTQHNVTTIDWADLSSDAIDPNEGENVRAAHINELRVAINKLRLHARSCDCDNFCDCTGNCTCNCNIDPIVFQCSCEHKNTCSCNTNDTWHDYLTAYSFSNESGDTSTSSESVTTTNNIDAMAIQDLRAQVDNINESATLNNREIDGNGLTF